MSWWDRHSWFRYHRVRHRCFGPRATIIRGADHHGLGSRRHHARDQDLVAVGSVPRLEWGHLASRSQREARPDCAKPGGARAASNTSEARTVPAPARPERFFLSPWNVRAAQTLARGVNG